MGADIVVEALSRSFGSTHALRDLSFSSTSGVIGLLGPNGAGKTTLLNILATIDAPTSGRATVGGYDLTGPRGRQQLRHTLGYVPQETALYPHFTVEQFVDHIACLKLIGRRDERRAEVDRVLAAVGLTDEASRRTRVLSGGMKRRVALAQALLGSPSLLLLDEPTVGLDLKQRLRFRETLSDASGYATVVVSSHETDELATIAEELVVVDRGVLLFQGSPAGLAAQAKGRVRIGVERTTAAAVSWRMGDGRFRSITSGNVACHGTVERSPTVEDGYLTVLADAGALAE